MSVHEDWHDVLPFRCSDGCASGRDQAKTCLLLRLVRAALSRPAWGSLHTVPPKSEVQCRTARTEGHVDCRVIGAGTRLRSMRCPVKDEKGPMRLVGPRAPESGRSVSLLKREGQVPMFHSA